MLAFVYGSHSFSVFWWYIILLLHFKKLAYFVCLNLTPLIKLCIFLSTHIWADVCKSLTTSWSTQKRSTRIDDDLPVMKGDFAKVICCTWCTYWNAQGEIIAMWIIKLITFIEVTDFKSTWHKKNTSPLCSLHTGLGYKFCSMLSHMIQEGCCSDPNRGKIASLLS